MKYVGMLFVAILLAAFPHYVCAQTVVGTYKEQSGTTRNVVGVTSIGSDGTSGREVFQLVDANTPSAPIAAYGGSYVFMQNCTTYGTVSLQYLGPDGVTYYTLLSKTSADSAGGTHVGIGAGQRMQAVLSGTTGCNVTLKRNPQ